MSIASDVDLVVGVDAHLDTHTAAICDDRERLVSQLQVPSGPGRGGRTPRIAGGREAEAWSCSEHCRQRRDRCRSEPSSEHACNRCTVRTHPEES